MKKTADIPEFDSSLLSVPYVQYLHSLIQSLSEQLEGQDKKIEELEAEIRRLKNLPKKPDIKPSKLDEETPPTEEPKKKKKVWKKGSKKENIEIHDQKPIPLESVPSGWEFKGYKSQVIQDFIVRANNIEYQLEVWVSPDGAKELIATLPSHLQGTDFGPILKGYILHQYNECGVSQPLIASSLKDFGVLISSGQINNILIENKEAFHAEKESLLAKGIELSEELKTDDTGARHKFKNGYCNCINTSLFTYFSTSYSKSRINFLEILRLEATNYELNEAALAYIHQADLPPKYQQILQVSYDKGRKSFKDKAALEAYFKSNGWTAKYALRTITEALLIGTIIEQGFDPNMVIHSDGAGQFNLFIHALCWKHAERPLVKLKSYNPIQQKLWDEKMTAYWSLYQALKKFKLSPDPSLVDILDKQFDELCEPVTNFSSLNQVLEELKAKKQRLLVVLTRPNTSLHNNDSERDIREYAKRRKLSAGTRSENGRKARDTFLSLKKTCRKLGISFWEYLLDRLQGINQIPPLSEVMEQKARMAKA